MVRAISKRLQDRGRYQLRYYYHRILLPNKFFSTHFSGRFLRELNVNTVVEGKPVSIVILPAWDEIGLLI